MVIDILTYLTFLSHIFIVLFLIFRSFFYRGYLLKKWKKISKHSLKLVLLISSVATLGSLYFSNVLNFNPCPLCWYQRVFMYVIPILSGFALYFEDSKIKRYINPLALIGLGIAIYHYIVQFTPSVICTGGLDCSISYLAELGYITIPMMAGTAFLLILILINDN